ncbi:tyrosine-type recombinase/integrase [Paraburkholderia sp. SARCC-3016]|uniref:tyrosine-type recombinase/integrase n=1 Tax=Paraburkholderia sp. SARCC-3016 TaxID=3058611 RepID=UPI0035BE1932
MDRMTRWITAPEDAYRLWQETEAVGADRRPFSARSRVQHTAMFDRFLRHLRTKDVTVATFGAADVESFFADVDTRCAPGTTTRLRYGKMLDRLCRHLVEEGIRTRNPVTAMATFERWPEDEPVPLFLDVDADTRLQEWVQPVAGDDDRASRNRAIVALLLGTGMTAAELRQTLCEHLVVDGARPHIEVPKRGPRESRRVSLPPFAIAPLSAWKEAVTSTSGGESLLFPAPGSASLVNDVLLGAVVRESLEAIGFRAPDMSPRVLRNTYARRQLLDGRSNVDVSRLLGLASQRTVVRLRATIEQSTSTQSVELT